MALLDDLGVRHEVLRPEDDADADACEGDGRAQAHRCRVGTDQGTGVPDGEQEVGHDEPDGADHRDDEPGCDLALSEALCGRTAVGDARLVLGETRVLEPVHLLELAARAAAVLNRGHSLPRLVLVVDEDWMVTWNAP